VRKKPDLERLRRDLQVKTACQQQQQQQQQQQCKQ
jgi:hypothetical protein